MGASTTSFTEKTFGFYYKLTRNALDYACVGPVLNYVYDSEAPVPAVSITDETDPANPTVEVSSVNPDDLVALYSDSNCSALFGGVDAQLAAGHSVSFAPSALASGTYTFYAKVVDFAGNISSCEASSGSVTVP